MGKTLSLGVDVGTSKISVALFNNQNLQWEPILFDGKVVSSALIGISENTGEARIGIPERELAKAKDIPVYSVKRCVICEQSLINVRTVEEHLCVNKANYINEKWCSRGAFNFTIHDMKWGPSQLFEQLLSDIFRKVDIYLSENYKDFKIEELKVGTPMVFHKGQYYVEWLQNKVNFISNCYLGQWFTKDRIIEVIEEPIAALMAHVYKRSEILPQGYFLVIDSGAGTTDIILCEKKGEKVYFIEHDSFYTAGDDYNNVMEAVIGSLGNDLPGKMKRQGVSIKDLKEEYCDKGLVTLSLLGETPKQFDSSVVEPSFELLTKQIIKSIEEYIDKWCIGKFIPKKIYITGGCFNVPSLRKGIENLCSRKKYTLEEINVRNPDLRGDHKILAVSMGCALPQREYFSTIKYQLPCKIIVLQKKIGEDTPSSQRFKDLGVLYDPEDKNKSESSGSLTLRDIDPNDNLIIALDTKRGERMNLCEVRAHRYFLTKRIKSRFSITLRYELSFNCKLIIKASSTHRREEIKIYDGYITY